MESIKRIEEKLKDLILERYKSIREFAVAIQMPYSTIDSIFKRGVENASITNIIKICRTLDISADMLASGEIVQTHLLNNEYTADERKIIEQYQSLNQEGQEKIIQYIEDLVLTGRYIKSDKYPMVNKKQA